MNDTPPWDGKILEDVKVEKTDDDCESYVPDYVNAPPHYRSCKIEPIDVIEAWGLDFCLGNCIKYIARHGKKASALLDLQKARWYLDRAISNMEKESNDG